MAITRRNALLGLAASLGAAAPMPGLPTALRALGTPPALTGTGPIELWRYFIAYWRKPIWQDAIAWEQLIRPLYAYSWHFDDQSYDTPLISCVENGRVFKAIYTEWGPSRHTGVFEMMISELIRRGSADQHSKELADAACHVAAWAREAMPDLRDVHKGAVYIDFADHRRPITTDAPPLVIHEWLSPSNWLDYGKDEGDELEEDKLEEGLGIGDEDLV